MVFFSLWLVPVGMRIFFGDICCRSLLKMTSTSPSRPFLLVAMYVTAFGLSVFFTMLSSSIVIDRTTGYIMLIGAANALAGYALWTAYKINMVRACLFSFLDDVIGMGLCVIFLNEHAHISANVFIGICLSLSCIMLFAWRDYKKVAEKKMTDENHTAFYTCVFIYTSIWGLATFLMRYWAVGNVPTSQFLPSWYGGAVIGSCLNMILQRFRSGSSIPLPTAREVSLSFATGATFILNMGGVFWALTMIPQVVAQPIFMVSELVCGAFVGLFLFNEKKHFALQEWSYISLGIAGSILVAFR